MDLFGALSAFVAVADAGGFAPAARKAGMATSSLARQVDTLEAHLHTILLNRSTRSVTLTPAGEDYYVQATRILADLDEANRSVSEREGPPRGLLRVSLPVAFGGLHVTPILPEFLKACPDVDLDLLMTDTVVNLVESRIDVAIRIGNLESSNMVARRLAPHRRVVCASPEYLRARGEPVDPVDLVHHSCLTFSYATGDRTWRFAKAGRIEQLQVRGALRANHSETLKEAALAGLGVLIMPTWLIGQELADGRLRRLLADWDANVGRATAAPQSDAGIHAIYLAERRGSTKVLAFTEFLMERFGSPPYWDRL
ncbi:DNA-binding transcriptional LysR family regulator [Luteibacter jiangsuensis]|uniref:DNA-binding transcriptional LysR family regulator n=1 Tax=Luteibacter jiangsuensis TaxID=637577 RepID=A0ABT9SVJ3_9GAMM|nr:LysR family transcriptional regulator [Luteibacter jiangsuensis]MDQ0008406.1 DNA-binding transcriptional LysR family regulator [Luteibacter jiangsuensis]